MEKKGYALGMVETKGFPALVAATDAASKAADVEIATYQKADGGIVTVYIIGDVASVQSAVAVGKAAGEKVGTVLYTHVIARPEENVKQMIFQLLDKKVEEKPKTGVKKEGKSEIKSSKDDKKSADTKEKKEKSNEK